MSKTIRIIVIVGIALLVAGMIFYPQIKTLFSGKSDSSITPSMAAAPGGQNLTVNAMVLKPETLSDVFRTKGVLLPDEEVDLIFETSGKITNINFKEGSFVNKGQLLAKVNDAPLQAELRKLEAQLPLAQERVFRQRTLLDKDAVSQEAFETVTTELDKLKADVELVKARIAQTELRAPFSGMIGLRMVSEGAYASPQVMISKLTKISPLKIEFSVNERQISEIGDGTKLTFTIENDLNRYEASVYAVETTLEANTLSLKARARYANPGGKLKPGRSANIEIELREITNTLVIPSIASIAEMGQDIAYTYQNGKAHRVILTKGLRTASSVQIVEGLDIGDTLLTTGVMQLRDGMNVSIANLEE
ncbi:MAG: efflux RND transporter periplasmic adaptor subunit [Dysgonamonadaceae bacterium]|nr:efflux RND transporter periplasmic adaptor subunit [Dysgonamonadaceae bacterium]MDD3728395.1 efflux RND transporter periplasmic adaptor subunit [Dysgonamonadaceae bacterium]MDD4246518.1 efflux RND transporter periplasmic adaptor subunit [Dysgonamonadaceae bacterium]